MILIMNGIYNTLQPLKDSLSCNPIIRTQQHLIKTMHIKNFAQVTVLAVFQLVPELVDLSVQIWNSVSTINEMDIHIFVYPSFEPTTTTLEPTTTPTGPSMSISTKQIIYIIIHIIRLT